MSTSSSTSAEFEFKSLKQFGDEHAIDGFAFDDDGYCCLMFDDVVVNLEIDDAGRVVLYANLGSAPIDQREVFFERLLNANYLFQQTSGGVPGYDSTEDIVLLTFQENGNHLDATTFAAMIENFINTATTWMERVMSFGHPDDRSHLTAGDDNARAGIRV